MTGRQNGTPTRRPPQLSDPIPGVQSRIAVSPRPQPAVALCPYCGHTSSNTHQCDRCKGLFEPLSRQASQNAMGPWYVRDEANSFRPGCSHDTLKSLIARGRVTRVSVLRGPTTRQFWTAAKSTPGIAHLLGECHSCHAAARSDDSACPSCGASFIYDHDRQFLGLAPMHLLPGHASPETIAASVLSSAPPGRPGGAPKHPQNVPGATPEPTAALPIRSRARPARSNSVLFGIVILCMLLAGALVSVIVLPLVGVPLPWTPQAAAGGVGVPPASTANALIVPIPPASSEPALATEPRSDETDNPPPAPTLPAPPGSQPEPANPGLPTSGDDQKASRLDAGSPMLLDVEDSERGLVRPAAAGELGGLPAGAGPGNAASLSADRNYAARRLEQLQIVRYFP